MGRGVEVGAGVPSALPAALSVCWGAAAAAVRRAACSGSVGVTCPAAVAVINSSRRTPLMFHQVPRKMHAPTVSTIRTQATASPCLNLGVTGSLLALLSVMLIHPGGCKA